MARHDAIDLACEQWAVVMRELLGLTQPRLARDYVGALRCTLAARRDLHHGSTSGKVEQNWPEFPFLGNPATVNAVYKRLAEPLQEIMVAHYVAMTPRSRSARADLMGLSVRVYWDRVARAKCSVDGAFAIVETVRTLSAPNRGINGIATNSPRVTSPP
jgi:hypothetical protein